MNIRALFGRSVSIQAHLLLMTCSLILFTTVIVTYFIYIRSAETMESSSREFLVEALNQLTRRNDLVLDKYFHATNSIVTSPVLQEKLAFVRNTEEELSQGDKKLFTDLLVYTTSEYPGILGFQLVDQRQNKYTFGYTNNFDCFQGISLQALDQDGGMTWYGANATCQYPLIMGARRIVNLSNINQPLGTLYMVLDQSVFRDAIKESVFSGEKGKLAVVGQQGEIILAQATLNESLKTAILEMVRNKQDPGQITIADTPYFAAQQHSDSSQWTYVSLIPQEQLLQGIDAMQRYSLKVALLVLVPALILAFLFARHISSPVKEVVRGMFQVENEKFPVHFASAKWLPLTEIEVLKSKFVMMAGRIQTLIEENYKRTIREQSAELSVLTAQINPHFLYNTLDSIYWMLYRKGEKDISRIILLLSSCFRYSISSPSEVVPLYKELEYVEHYLAIQQIRFQHKIECVIDIEEELKQFPVFKLMLQPIVENAVTHGIAPVEGNGRIDIVGRRVGDRIKLAVKDNGVGMNPQKLQDLVDGGFRKHAEPGGKGLGLRYVHRRTEWTYGESYGLEVESELYAGTTVTICLPWLAQEKINPKI